MVATLSAVLYIGGAAAQYSGALGAVAWMRPVAELPPIRVAIYTAGANLLGYFAVALLSGYLAESLRRAGARLQRASTEIADLQAFNQHVIDSLASGLVTADYNGAILTFNRAAESITGLNAAGVAGTPIVDTLQFPEEFWASLRAFEGGIRRADYRFTTADSRMIDVGVSATHLVTPGGRAGFLFTFQDVTDMRRLEREARVRQRLAAVGEMAAGIAHEIRNPLASISGSIQMLRQDLPLTEEQERLMDIILRESERLNATIRSFLAYARPQKFAVKPVDVRTLLAETAALLRNSPEIGRHEIETSVSDQPMLVEADEGQLRQVLWNLATNAVKAMPGGGRLKLGAAIRSTPGANSGACVEITVEDEGVGMPADELDLIFQPFHGGFAKGSGLGLAIVHRIVSDYSGEIHVQSEPGRGTRITVQFPIPPAPPVEPPPAPALVGAGMPTATAVR
jgi:two-component system sensor histidine kinase PilS (NtrC family)